MACRLHISLSLVALLGACSSAPATTPSPSASPTPGATDEAIAAPCPSGAPAIADPNAPLMSADALARWTSYFTVEDGQLRGEGGDKFAAIIAESQFISFGERHGSQQTSKLMSALIPLLAAEGYDALALEVGPHSVRKLAELSTPPEGTVDALRAFNTAYYVAVDDDFVIPFFDGIEDARFLATASRSGLALWGLDQEYVFAASFLFDELLARAEGRPDHAAIAASKRAADAELADIFADIAAPAAEGNPYGRFGESPPIISYLAHFKGNAEAEAIIADLRISWDIYARSASGDSHVDRVSYMRNNFLARYAELEARDADPPKVFLKFGQVHAAQTKNRGAYDLGHLTETLAQQSGSQSANFNCWTRFIEDEGKQSDYLYDRDWYRRVSMFLELGRRDQWTLIDLAAIRSEVDAGRLRLPSSGDFHAVNSLLRAYDYQLILPLDRWVETNADLPAAPAAPS